MNSNLIFKNTVLFCALSIFSCGKSAQVNSTVAPNTTQTAPKNIQKNQTLLTGAQVLAQDLSLLKNKKVGIITNQTGILDNQTHLVDFLLKNNINVTTIYAPEHGFRGTADAGELIKDGKDTKTGLPIISLYGNNKKPKPEQLAAVDIMLFDLQDVGARFYTYISSLHYAMEACAEQNIPIVVLDRPNPNGAIIDGPILEPEHTSFVGMHTIPVLHGMTIGEYAKMINGEGWLKNNAKANLTVIACKNYNHNQTYNLPVKPSPNLPNAQAINLYASLCFFEGTNVSVGRGTETQFQVYGSPFITNLPYKFTPKPNFGAKDPMHNGKICIGEDLTKEPKLTRLELKYLITAYQNTADKTKFFNSFFTKLAGTKKLQQQIEMGMSEDEIRASWEVGLQQFQKTRAKYLLY